MAARQIGVKPTAVALVVGGTAKIGFLFADIHPCKTSLCRKSTSNGSAFSFVSFVCMDGIQAHIALCSLKLGSLLCFAEDRLQTRDAVEPAI